MPVSASSEPPSVDEPDDAGASTRDRLLWAAYELLITNGYEATTVQAVARRAGLTTGAIYANFGGKQDLMAHAVLDEWYRTERATLDEYLAAHSPGDLADLAERIDRVDGPTADAFTRLMAHHVAGPPAPEHRLLTEVTGAIIRGDISESPLLVSVRMIEKITRASVENGKQSGRISTDLDTDALVAVIVNVYLGAITSKSLGLPQPDLDETLRVLEAANSGYAPRGPADTGGG